MALIVNYKGQDIYSGQGAYNSATLKTAGKYCEADIMLSAFISAEVTVTSLEGATVDVKKNGVIIDTYTYGSAETEHTFASMKMGDSYRIVANKEGLQEAYQDITITQFTHTLTVKPSELPFSYQQLSYLAADGTQYCDSGYVFSFDADWTLDGYFGFTTNDRGMGLSAYGGLGDPAPLSFEIYNNFRFRFYVNGDIVTVNSGTSSTYTTVHLNVTYTASTGVIQAETLYQRGSGTLTEAYRRHNNSTALMFADRSGYRFKQGVIGDFTITDADGEHHYIPCKRRSDGVTGYYEVLSQSFITNLGTGTFVEGSPV